jgi:Zn-dependent metalloprotease
MSCSHFCSIVPPHILHYIAETDDEALRRNARAALALSERLRGSRMTLAGGLAGALPTGTRRRTVYDAKNGTSLPGVLVRDEVGRPSDDPAVERAFQGAGNTYDFYNAVYGRASIDDHGLRLDSTVHFGASFDNAFWNGRQMVYGDGDGVIFGDFTSCLDVIGHELTHGITQYTAKLTYNGQPGALNESMSDVFGVLVKQWTLGQSASEADWLIGAGLFTPAVKGAGLRSMKAPGTAYNDPRIGRDPQPGHMSDYVFTTEDDGGVHINSGIPNHAFFLAAIEVGGRAWERAGVIWYDALTRYLRPHATFEAAGAATAAAASARFGRGSIEEQAVRKAWRAVGVGAPSLTEIAPTPEFPAAAALIDGV